MATGKGSRQRLVPVGAQALDWVRRYLDDGAPAAREARRTPPRSFSTDPAAPCRVRRCGVLKKSARRAGVRAAAVSPAHAAPLLREPPARARRRPALGAGHAGTCRHLDHADLHAPVVERGPRHVPQVSPARAEGGLIRGEGGRRLSAGGAARGRPRPPPRHRGPAATRPGRARARGVPPRRRPRVVLGPRRVARAADLRARVAGTRRAARGRPGVVRPAGHRRGGARVGARRLLASGTPMVLVRGAVASRCDRAGSRRCRRNGDVARRPARSPASRARRDSGCSGAAGKIGESMGTRVYAVGGFVRDLMLGRVALDIDLVVEGDGIAFARQLSEETGGVLTVHGFWGRRRSRARRPRGTRPCRAWTWHPPAGAAMSGREPCRA